jgi:hypothetical protein
MRGAVWTAEQQKELERLAALDIAASLIATAVNKTRNAVIGRARREKVKLRENWPRGTPDAYPCGHERSQSNTRIRRYLTGPSAGIVKMCCLICSQKYELCYARRKRQQARPTDGRGPA